MKSLKRIFIALVCPLFIILAGCAPEDITATGGGGGGGGGGGAVASLTVRPDANPVLVGGNTFVRATVMDAAGNLVPNVTVTFTISASSTATGTLNPASGQAITNASGVASVQFNATGAGTMIIQAAVGSLTQSTTIAVTTAAPGPPASVVVSASPGTINVGGLSNITATVRDSNGTILSGVTVDFAVTPASLGGVNPSLATTNTSGQASTVLTALTSPGTVTIRATAGAVSGEATVVISSLPAALNLTVGPPTTINTLSNVSLQAYVTNTFGQPVSDGTVVTFTSPNLLGGTLTATAVTVNGYATATYQAANTTGVVSVTASCTTGSAPSDTKTITVQASPVGSIQFVSAVPNVIGVKGSGQPETSTITFSVKDQNGYNIADGTQVRFVMTGPNGGEFIGVNDPPNEKVHTVSTSAGRASVILNSGMNAGPVKVTATVLDSLGNPTTVTSSSTGVSIGGGVPSARHFSVSTTVFNLAGLAYDNQQATINVLIADRFGNYNILPATSVSFYTEAGAIDASNITNSEGATTAMLRTQEPRPVDVAPAAWEDWYTATPHGYTRPATYNPRDGWVRVLVVTRGEEKFYDANGNGLFDSGEFFDDLGEPFIDANNNGVYDGVTELYTDSNANGRYDRGEVFAETCPGTYCNGVRDEAEFYVDANADGSYTGPNGAWDNDINIWQGIDLVFSGEPTIAYVPDTGFQIGAGYTPCASYLIRVYDVNMNTITPGSKVTIATSVGSLTGGGDYTIPDGLSTGPYDIPVTVCDDDTDADPKPGGITTSVTWKVPGRGDLIVTRTMPGVVY